MSRHASQQRGLKSSGCANPTISQIKKRKGRYTWVFALRCSRCHGDRNRDRAAKGDWAGSVWEYEGAAGGELALRRLILVVSLQSIIGKTHHRFVILTSVLGSREITGRKPLKPSPTSCSLSLQQICGQKVDCAEYFRQSHAWYLLRSLTTEIKARMNLNCSIRPAEDWQAYGADWATLFPPDNHGEVT